LDITKWAKKSGIEVAIVETKFEKNLSQKLNVNQFNSILVSSLDACDSQALGDFL
jgi:hypothetical protein